MIKIILYILLFGSVSLIFVNCEDEVNKEPPPARVVLVDKVPDTSAFEHGIDAAFDENRSDANSIFLEWHPNSERTLTGYSVYRSEFPDKNFLSVGTITKEYDIIDTVFYDTSALLYQRYYYFVRAFDEFDQYSEPSDTVYYELIEHPILQDPNPSNDSNAPVFRWEFRGTTPQFFIFRLLKKNIGGPYIPVYIKLLEISVEYGSLQEWPLSKLTSMNTLTSGMYIWRIDPYGGDFLGAESDWLDFIVP